MLLVYLVSVSAPGEPVNNVSVIDCAILEPELTNEFINRSEPGFRMPAVTICVGFCAKAPIAAIFSAPTFTIAAPFFIAEVSGPKAAFCPANPTSAEVAAPVRFLLIEFVVTDDNAVVSFTGNATELNPAPTTEDNAELNPPPLDPPVKSVFMSTP